jgi:nucleotide-binding universal stress UspA family protein
VSSLGSDPQSGRIVVGVDGSRHSENALRWALGQARLTGRPVEAVVSWSIPVDFGVGGVSAVAGYDWEGVAAGTLQDTVARSRRGDRAAARRRRLSPSRGPSSLPGGQDDPSSWRRDSTPGRPRVDAGPS